MLYLEINEFGARFFLSVALLIQLILIYKTTLLLFNDKKNILTVCRFVFFNTIGFSIQSEI